MQEKELNNGRIAMLAVAGFMASGCYLHHVGTLAEL
jgi:hypothetical protein